VNNQLCNPDDSQEMRWKNIKGTIEVAAKDLRTKDISIKEKHWFNDECQRAVMKQGKKCYKTLPPESTEEYKLTK